MATVDYVTKSILLHDKCLFLSIIIYVKLAELFDRFSSRSFKNLMVKVDLILLLF